MCSDTAGLWKNLKKGVFGFFYSGTLHKLKRQLNDNNFLNSDFLPVLKFSTAKKPQNG